MHDGGNIAHQDFATDTIPFAVDVRAVKSEGCGLMPTRRASSLDRTTPVAPVSTIMRTCVPLMVAWTKKCPLVSAGIVIADGVGCGRASPLILASNSALVSPRRGIKSGSSLSCSSALDAHETPTATDSATVIRMIDWRVAGFIAVPRERG
jgi:hypothetical protein